MFSKSDQDQDNRLPRDLPIFQTSNYQKTVEYWKCIGQDNHRNFSSNVSDKSSLDSISFLRSVNAMHSSSRKQFSRETKRSYFIETETESRICFSDSETTRRDLRSVKYDDLSSDEKERIITEDCQTVDYDDICTESEVLSVASTIRSCPRKRFADVNQKRNSKYLRIHDYNKLLWKQEVFSCVQRGDLTSLKRQLFRMNTPAIRKLKDEVGNNLWHCAAKSNNLLCIKWLCLLPNGDEPLFDRNNYSLNPIVSGIKRGSLEVVQWIIKHTIAQKLVANVDTGERTLLHFAAKYGNNRILNWISKYMLLRGYNLNHQDYRGYTALHLAAKYNHFNCLKTLVLRNVEMNLTDHQGMTAEDIARSFGFLECLQYLIALQACVSLAEQNLVLQTEFSYSKMQNNELENCFKDLLYISKNNLLRNSSNGLLEETKAAVRLLEDKWNAVKSATFERNTLPNTAVNVVKLHTKRLSQSDSEDNYCTSDSDESIPAPKNLANSSYEMFAQSLKATHIPCKYLPRTQLMPKSTNSFPLPKVSSEVASSSFSKTKTSLREKVIENNAHFEDDMNLSSLSETMHAPSESGASCDRFVDSDVRAHFFQKSLQSETKQTNSVKEDNNLITSANAQSTHKAEDCVDFGTNDNGNDESTRKEKKKQHVSNSVSNKYAKISSKSKVKSLFKIPFQKLSAISNKVNVSHPPHALRVKDNSEHCEKTETDLFAKSAPNSAEEDGNRSKTASQLLISQNRLLNCSESTETTVETESNTTSGTNHCSDTKKEDSKQDQLSEENCETPKDTNERNMSEEANCAAKSLLRMQQFGYALNKISSASNEILVVTSDSSTAGRHSPAQSEVSKTESALSPPSDLSKGDSYKVSQKNSIESDQSAKSALKGIIKNKDFQSPITETCVPSTAVCEVITVKRAAIKELASIKSVIRDHEENDTSKESENDEKTAKARIYAKKNGTEKWSTKTLGGLRRRKHSNKPWYDLSDDEDGLTPERYKCDKIEESD